MGRFIEIEVRDRLFAGEGQRRDLVNLCPVDIFSRDGQGGVVVQAEQEDECTLCDLCLQHAPAGAVVIHKLYDRSSASGSASGSAPGSASGSAPGSISGDAAGHRI